MGLISKIEDKLSGNKHDDTSNTVDSTGQDVRTGGGLGDQQIGGYSGSGLAGQQTGVHGSSHVGPQAGVGSGIAGGPAHGSGLAHDPDSTSATAPNSDITGSSHHGGHSGPHHGSGLATGTAVGSGIGATHSGSHVGNEALGSSHRGEAGDVGSRDYVPGPNIGAASRGIGHSGDSHTIPRQPFDPTTSKGQRIAADAADRRHAYEDSNVTGSRTGGIGHHTQDTDFVPGSSSAAQNPSAIPTAGGQRVGGDHLDTRSHDDHSHGHHGGADNRGIMEKAKDKLSSSRVDRPDDPVTGRNYDQDVRGNTGLSSSHAGSNTAAGLAGGAAAGSALGGNHH